MRLRVQRCSDRSTCSLDGTVNEVRSRILGKHSIPSSKILDRFVWTFNNLPSQGIDASSTLPRVRFLQSYRTQDTEVFCVLYYQ